jgi:predicted RNase H-like HicB family nuclease/predicted RNA binding protein YcfA (HicA-like mRNA interferase family)
MKYRDIVKVIERNGWILARTRGSHRQYTHRTKPGVVTIAGHLSGSDVPLDTQLNFEAGRFEVKDYVVILEPAADGTWGAYVPDLPGCTSGGKTRDEAAKNVRQAIEGHVELLRQTGQRVPDPVCAAEIVRVA